jgi:hypothetical protein
MENQTRKEAATERVRFVTGSMIRIKFVDLSDTFILSRVIV